MFSSASPQNPVQSFSQELPLLISHIPREGTSSVRKRTGNSKNRNIEWHLLASYFKMANSPLSFPLRGFLQTFLNSFDIYPIKLCRETIYL